MVTHFLVNSYICNKQDKVGKPILFKRHDFDISDTIQFKSCEKIKFMSLEEVAQNLWTIKTIVS